MSKIRVSNLAEKLGIDIRETLARLKEIGVEAKAAVSLVEEDAVKKLLTPQPKEGSASTDEVRVTTNIIRRRAKAVHEAAAEEAPQVAAAVEPEKKTEPALVPKAPVVQPAEPVTAPKEAPAPVKPVAVEPVVPEKHKAPPEPLRASPNQARILGRMEIPGVTTRPTRVVTKETPTTPRTAPARPAPGPAPRSGDAPVAAPPADQDRPRMKQVQLTPAAPSSADSRRPGGKKEGPGHGPDAGKGGKKGGAPGKKKEQPKKHEILENRRSSR
jgi:translation initiation factor IF-2